MIRMGARIGSDGVVRDALGRAPWQAGFRLERTQYIRRVLARASRGRWLAPWDVENLAEACANKYSGNPARTLAALGIPGPAIIVGMVNGMPAALPWDEDYIALMRVLDPFRSSPGLRAGFSAELAVLNHLIKEKTGWPRLSMSRLRSFEARSRPPFSSS